MKTMTILFFKWMLSTAGFIQIGLFIGLLLFVKLIIQVVRGDVVFFEDIKEIVTDYPFNKVMAVLMFAFLLLGYVNAIAGDMSFMPELGEWLDSLFTKK